MKIIQGLLIASASILCGCVSVEPVKESANNPSVSTTQVACGKPIGFTQDCDSFNGAKRKIEIDDQAIRIAGNEEGDVVLIMDGDMWKNTLTQNPFVFSSYKSSRAVNDAYYLVKSVLEDHKISITDTHTVAMWGDIDGYVIELDGNGYDVLKTFSVDSEE